MDHAILPDKMTLQGAGQTQPNLAYEIAWQPSMLRKNILSTESTETKSTNWLLRYSSIAFTLLVLLQVFALMVVTPRFQDLLEGFGGSVETATAFALEYYWTGCLANIAISVAGSAYLWLIPTAAQSRLKAAYGLWKNERNNSFIKADEETISIREGIGVDRFSLGDIDQFHVKPESLLKHLSFTAQGIKRWYPLAGLSNGEVSELVEFARRHNRQQRANQ